jgi:hypothetical protein
VFITGTCDEGCVSAGVRAIYTIALNVFDGTLNWSTTTNASIGDDFGDAVATDDRHVYIGGLSDGAYYTSALSQVDGTLIWASTYDPTAFDEGVGDIGVDGDSVYIAGLCFNCGSEGSNAFNVHSLGKTNGDFGWATVFDFDNNGDGATSITQDASSLFVGGYCSSCGLGGEGMLTIALDKQTGQLLDGNSTLDMYGAASTSDFTVAASSSVTGPRAMTVSGDFANLGTFAGFNTDITFNGPQPGISGNLTGDSALGNVTLAPGGDGTSWATTTAAGDNDSWTAVTFGNDTFVAVNFNCTSDDDCVMYSTDGN